MPARRDGHLDDLDLELAHAEPEQHAELMRHLHACEACTTRLQALRNASNSVEIPHSVAPTVQVPKPANIQNRRSWFVGISAAAAIALAAMVGLRSEIPNQPQSEFRPKGSDITLQVFVHDGDAVHTASTGGTVHPGDRLGFRVTPRQDGFLYVVGFDDEDAYPCWPQDADSPAQHVDASGTAMDLDSAIELDARLGTERIVAVLCDEPADFDTVIRTASGSDSRTSCILDEVVLEKVAP
jgi:hypothetical protein